MKKLYGLFATTFVLALIVVGCTTGGPTPTLPNGNINPVTINVWYGWTGAEADAMNAAFQKFAGDNRNITVKILAVPFDQLRNKFTTEASTGGGPDLLIGAKDWIGELAQAKLITPLDDLKAESGLNDLNPAAVDANKFQGKIWAFPESSEAVALWYNTDKVKNPPKDSDELLKMGQTVGLGVNTQFYSAAGFIFAEGAQLFDQNQKCILDQGSGAVDALNFIKTAKRTPNVIAEGDTSKLDAAFRDGKIALVFNGPWATGDYAKALGQGKIAVAPPIVMKPSNKTFAPFLGIKNFFLSANSKGDAQAAALKFLKFFSQPETQAAFAKVGHIPSNPKTQVDDPIIAGFLKQTQSATYFPNEPEMGAVWTPAGDMIFKVMEGKADAATAAKDACIAINSANKKQ